ncbi:MAG: hypothetical protein JXP34_22110 [Planctomycetes bacterium]|nr:hypothetical protein [Planctomycetota bacterium]
MAAPVTIGFDAMCADISLVGIGAHIAKVKEMFPDLGPLMDALAGGKDDEVAAETVPWDAGRVLDMLERLRKLPGVEVDTHIGANAALELVTAQALLADPAGPIRPAEVLLLGNTSPKVLSRVPEKIRPEILRHAQPIPSEAISIIFPHAGRRVILSYGGDPPLRRLSDPLRAYLRDRLPAILREIRPRISLLVGTTNTWATATAADFDLLDSVIAAVGAAGAKALLDLGGIGGWTPENRRRYFESVAKADVILCNDDELARLYEDRAGARDAGRGAPEIAAMARAIARPGQAVVVHTARFQVAVGLPEGAAAAMEFASRVAAVRAAEGIFPTARRVMGATLAPSPEGRREVARLAAGEAAAPAYEVEVRNTVGLGDTWTSSFILAAIGQGIL